MTHLSDHSLGFVHIGSLSLVRIFGASATVDYTASVSWIKMWVYLSELLAAVRLCQVILVAMDTLSRALKET